MQEERVIIKCEAPTDGRFKNLVTEPPTRFGRLIVVSYAGQCLLAGRYRNMWNCECDCGNETVVKIDHLTGGKIVSCGCFGQEQRIASRVTHHKSRTKIYRTYVGMITRCYNINTPNYADYGGRGITVCDRWLESFENFYEDMKDPESKEFSLDRRDVNGNYCLANCRWATSKEQNNNTRVNVRILYNDKFLTASEWSDITGLPYQVIYTRNKKGWPPEKTLTTPVKTRKIE